MENTIDCPWCNCAITIPQNNNQQLIRIIQDIHWMARRYANGRSSYATSMFNDAIKRLVILEVPLDNPDGTLWAKDSMGPKYCGLSQEEYDEYDNLICKGEADGQ